MHLPNNKFMYTSMYLSLLSTSSITKASVNPFWQSFFPHMRSNANCVCKSLATVLLKAVFNPIWCFLKGLAYCFKTHTHTSTSLTFFLYVYAFDLNITEKSSPQFIEVTRESCKKECPTPNCMLKTS